MYISYNFNFVIKVIGRFVRSFKNLIKQKEYCWLFNCFENYNEYINFIIRKYCLST